MSRAPARISLFFTSTMNTSFIRDDIELLARHVDLDVWLGAGLGAPLEVLRRARRADVSFSWFCSVYTFFMVLGARGAGRRTIIMIGGVDAARDARIGYGIWLSRWRRPLLRWALSHADDILAVDATLAEELRRSSGLPLPGIRIVPTGYDVDRWRGGEEKEDDLVLTVAVSDTLERARLKGIDLFIAAARRMPHLRFRAIGVHAEVAAALTATLAAEDLRNLELMPPVPREELDRHYRSAKIYCQLSLREGLPNALCEGMLSECIPVGTRVGGIPTAIGDCGFLIASGDRDELCARLAEAAALPAEAGRRARARIAELFPRERRERELMAIINRQAS